MLIKILFEFDRFFKIQNVVESRIPEVYGTGEDVTLRGVSVEGGKGGKGG